MKLIDYKKTHKFEIVLPGLYNTSSKPDEKTINNYSVWVPNTLTEEKPQIYINGKWFNFGEVIILKEKEEQEKRISNKEYNLLKAIRKFIEEEY